MPVGQALRSGTAAAHHALDHHPLMQRLIASGLTRAQYADTLAAMHGPHARLEHLVHGSRHHANCGLVLGTRRDLLEADLRELGRPIPALEPMPDTGEAGAAAWWGQVYVLEGSRQGGAFIAKRLRRNLGVTVPLRFFTAAMAPGDHDILRAMSARALDDDAELERGIASAQAAFADYHAGLDAWARADAPPTIGRAA